MQTKAFKISSPLQRILLIVFGLLCLVWLFFAAKWFFGNAIATRVLQKEVAELAVSLAPNDPQTHLTAAVLYNQSFQPEDLPKALAEYEKAVALSPNDYRLWLAFGKALERTGKSESAAKALQKALELAPHYAEVRWVYGNILLRQGKTAEAFAEIRRAVEGDPKFAAPAATTAWDIFEGDLEAVRKNIGDSASVKSALAVYLANQKRFDEALQIRNSIPENIRKTTFKEDGEKIFSQLIADKKYRSATRIKSELAGKDAAGISVGKITNGGFETAVNAEKAEVFEWEIAAGDQPQIGVNNEQKHSGGQSLVLVFNSAVGKEFRNVSQIVAVEGGREYEFEAFYKSALETSATVKWEIVEAASGRILASTDAIGRKTDWKSSGVRFTTPEESEGIIIRLVRENCASADCSISGTVWFDDVSLK